MLSGEISIVRNQGCGEEERSANQSYIKCHNHVKAR